MAGTATASVHAAPQAAAPLETPRTLGVAAKPAALQAAQPMASILPSSATINLPAAARGPTHSNTNGLGECLASSSSTSHSDIISGEADDSPLLSKWASPVVPAPSPGSTGVDSAPDQTVGGAAGGDAGWAADAVPPADAAAAPAVPAQKLTARKSASGGIPAKSAAAAGAGASAAPPADVIAAAVNAQRQRSMAHGPPGIHTSAQRAAAASSAAHVVHAAAGTPQRGGELRARKATSGGPLARRAAVDPAPAGAIPESAAPGLAHGRGKAQSASGGSGGPAAEPSTVRSADRMPFMAPAEAPTTAETPRLTARKSASGGAAAGERPRLTARKSASGGAAAGERPRLTARKSTSSGSPVVKAPKPRARKSACGGAPHAPFCAAATAGRSPHLQPGPAVGPATAKRPRLLARKSTSGGPCLPRTAAAGLPAARPKAYPAVAALPAPAAADGPVLGAQKCPRGAPARPLPRARRTSGGATQAVPLAAPEAAAAGDTFAPLHSSYPSLHLSECTRTQRHRSLHIHRQLADNSHRNASLGTRWQARRSKLFNTRWCGSLERLCLKARKASGNDDLHRSCHLACASTSSAAVHASCQLYPTHVSGRFRL